MIMFVDKNNKECVIEHYVSGSMKNLYYSNEISTLNMH